MQQLGEFSGTGARKAELVLGEVKAGHRPAELVERHQVEAGAAAEIEAPSRPRSGQAAEDFDEVRAGHHVLVVPRCDPVVVRDWHRPIVAPAWECDGGDAPAVIRATCGKVKCVSPV